MRTTLLLPWFFCTGKAISAMYSADNPNASILLGISVIYIAIWAAYMESQIWKYRNLYMDSLENYLKMKD